MQKKVNFLIYLLPLLSIFLVTYFWDQIKFDYNNHGEVIGYYSFFYHNDFTDTARYIFFTSIPLLLFFVLFILIKKDDCIKFNDLFVNYSIKKTQKNNLLIFSLYFYILILVLKFFSSEFSQNSIDIFHEGQLLVGAYNYFLSGELWKSTYIISGLFMDVLNANLAWFFSDTQSIGSYRFYIFFLQFLTAISFILLSYNISKSLNYENNEEILLFVILSSSSVFLVNTGGFVFRDLPIVFLLIICLELFRTHKKNNFLSIGLGFLTLLSLLWSLDRGMYFNATLTCVFIMLICMRRYLQIFYIILGVCLSWAAFYFIIGSDNFFLFFDQSFTILKYMDFQQGIIYPTPFSDELNATRGTKNLLIIIINGFFVTSALLNKKNKIPHGTKLFLVILFIISFFFYKSGLSRSDSPHMKQAISFSTILFVIFIYFHLLNFISKNFNNIKNNFIFKKKIFLFLFLVIFYQGNINTYKIGNIFTFKDRYLSYINLHDNVFLLPGDKKVIEMFSRLVKDEKCVQMFNYHTAYSYLLKKKTCSKFSHIFNLGPKKHQFDYINELKQTKPKYILTGKNNQQYNASNIENNKSNFLYYSFVNPYVRFPYINNFISNNYKTLKEFNNWVILIRIS